MRGALPSACASDGSIAESPVQKSTLQQLARPGIFGRAAQLGALAHQQAADRVWSRAASFGWGAIRHPTPLGGGSTVVLVDDDASTADYAVSGIVEAFPHWSLEAALTARLHVDRCGECRLYNGTGAARAVDTLRQLGLDARLRTGVHETTGPNVEQARR